VGAQKNNRKPWQVKRWCIPKITPPFLCRMTHLLALYARPYDPLYPVICFDEKSYQLLADSRVSLPLRPKHPRRQDYEYRRRGTRHLFVMVAPLAGQRHVRLTQRRTKTDFAHAVR
jgi:hypothetical protein